MITILVAYDDERGIGVNNDLPWHLPADLKLFKQRTKDQIVIMGSKTYASLPKRPLPHRQNVVLTRHIWMADQKPENMHYAHSPQTALALCQQWPEKEIFVIGGAQVYQAFLEQNLVERVWASEVSGYHHADTFFPELPSSFHPVNFEDHEGFTVVEYIKC